MSPGPLRLLLAEDSAEDAELMRLALDVCGAPVALQVATDGEAALRLLRAASPALVVLDLNMPRVGGLEVLRAIRAAPPPPGGRVPVAVLSSSSVLADVQRAYAAGADLFLTKPVGFADFCLQVEALLAFAVSGVYAGPGLRPRPGPAH